MPFFSIILPIRKEFKRLHYCLPSLLKQTFQDFEIIMVEDPETSDKTKEFVDSLNDSRIKYLIHSKGLRLPAKRNYGSKYSSGQYLYFIDADMEFPSGVLQDIKAKIDESQAKIVFVPERTPGKPWANRMKNLEKRICDGNVNLSAARLVAKSVFDEIEGFTEELIVTEDGDFSDRARATSAKWVFSTTPVNHYEVSESAIKHFQKKFKYGVSSSSYFEHTKKNTNVKQAENEKARGLGGRTIYFTSPIVWEKPFDGIQFIIFKFIEFFVMFVGLVYGKIFKSEVIHTR